MDDDIKDRLTSRDIWVRTLYMIFFVIAYGVAELVLSLVVLFQFVTILFTGSANAQLLRFGHNLSQYVYQILQFETFNTEDKAFPFEDWPDEEAADSRWLANEDPIEPPSEPAAATTPAEHGDSGLDADAVDEPPRS